MYFRKCDEQGIYLHENIARSTIFFFQELREILRDVKYRNSLPSRGYIFPRRSKYRERASFAGYVSSRVRRSFDEILITSFLLHVSRWVAALFGIRKSRQRYVCPLAAHYYTVLHIE